MWTQKPCLCFEDEVVTTKVQEKPQKEVFCVECFLDKEMNLDTKGVWVVTYLYSDH